MEFMFILIKLQGQHKCPKVGSYRILLNRPLFFKFFTLLFFLFLGKGTAQEYHLLSEEDKWKIRLHSYVLIDIDKINSSNISSLMQGAAPLAVYIQEYKEAYLPLLNQLDTKNRRMLVLGKAYLEGEPFPENITQFVSMDVVDTVQWNWKVFLKDSLRSVPSKELTFMPFAHKEIIGDSSIVKLWKKTGRVPNFIQVDPQNFLYTDSVVQRLNRIKRVFGTVRSKNGLLNGVGFKNHKNLRVDGNFSFPRLSKEDLPVFIPHKAGYYFSPDIIRTTADNSGNLKEFIGFPLDPEFGITDHFSFGPIIKNNIRKNNSELIVNKVELVDDRSRGKVGYFDNGAYVDAGLDSRMALQGSFTISAWIKPTVLNRNNSILGKGESFVLKLHEGLLTFTMADIKDYISPSSPVPVNEWTHVALVHSTLNDDLSFFINGIQTDKIQLIEDYDTSEYDLVIGSNLWQEFFIGYLDNIKIWNRELNQEEIFKEYDTTSQGDAVGLHIFLIPLIGVLTVLVLLLILHFWRKRNRLNANISKPIATAPVKLEATTPVAETSEYGERIRSFGPLKISVADGSDIAKKLSPKLKQLFLVVLLHSVGGKKGISTKKLTEFLWPGMSSSSAKNTRGTNIQNLRAILADSASIRLIFKEKLWFLEVGEDCFCEYQVVHKYLDSLGKEDIEIKELESRLPSLLEIIKEERFLSNTEDAWLDPFVEKLSNRILEFCQGIAAKLNLEEHNVLLHDLASVMYIYDDLNENALQLKLQILIKQGKLSTAHSVYDKFAKLYKKLYGETYPIKFEDILGDPNVIS
ncbi:hypothetical protein KCTC52924_02119 [Arenibacter antarcticus]